MRLEQCSRRIFTANAGLTLLGEAIRAAQLEAAVAERVAYRGGLPCRGADRVSRAFDVAQERFP